jgi:hypothetical protein
LTFSPIVSFRQQRTIFWNNRALLPKAYDSWKKAACRFFRTEVRADRLIRSFSIRSDQASRLGTRAKLDNAGSGLNGSVANKQNIRPSTLVDWPNSIITGGCSDQIQSVQMATLSIRRPLRVAHIPDREQLQIVGRGRTERIIDRVRECAARSVARLIGPLPRDPSFDV